MKIVPGQQQPTPISETPTSDPKPAGSSPQRPGPQAIPTGDRVRLSETAQWRLKVRPADQPERLAQLKASIAAGTYQVSSRLVAQKMLEDSVDL
ncbi:hypothetical protein GMLC_39140 [Geomonas limicola]|uniref:Anti-sigma-28 factor FlgM C-terminal domain-containing protein n=1 Tax=Geomonas limicola TaxID=2740186 RepID=A0A6V8NCJ2_9BACT|nr:flagellar biosynthesis anti-sigma factor FlgM [Geomonas limicola]GFO70335.1 hypothetical protein GMLC_39140 [Geomonas limicola]